MRKLEESPAGPLEYLGDGKVIPTGARVEICLRVLVILKVLDLHLVVKHRHGHPVGTASACLAAPRQGEGPGFPVHPGAGTVTSGRKAMT